MRRQRTVLVFVKYPEPGRVKTRLAATISVERAAELYRGWSGMGLSAAIRWSSQQTLADHLTRCRDRGWSFALLPPRHDIDTETDWTAYLERSQRSEVRGQKNTRPTSDL